MTTEARDNQGIEKQITELVTLSSEYVRVLENAESLEKEQFIQVLYRMGMMLYLSGLALPATEDPDDGGCERYVTEEEWETLLLSLQKLLGSEDAFLYFDMTSAESEPARGSLSELCTDVYQDLRDFTTLMAKGSVSALRNAVYEIKRLHSNHWGPRLLIIQQYLHTLVNKDEETGFEDLD